MHNPYNDLELRAFWKPAVGSRNCLEIEELWRSKLSLTREDKVITAGSCFAQHIGRALATNGFNWLDAEPGPGSPELNKKYGYGVFSFRTGNIYSAALLDQWIKWALDPAKQDREVWKSDTRALDPCRPTIEPNGFVSPEEMFAARQVTLAAIKLAISEARTFVFTMGLTEGWINTDSGVSYAMCPGTLGGSFDSARHRFVNYRYSEILTSMRSAIASIRSVNPNIQFLLTVSPVPLTATASGAHILPATTYSKSVLRAVAGDLAADDAAVDYFPSYEIISSAPYRGMFYLPNQREVSLKGVEHVMTHFFAGLHTLPATKPARQIRVTQTVDDQLQSAKGRMSKRENGAQATDEGDVQCEEAMLEAFAR